MTIREIPKNVLDEFRPIYRQECLVCGWRSKNWNSVEDAVKEAVHHAGVPCWKVAR